MSTHKNKEDVYNFWIIKITYMEDKVSWQLNSKPEEISIHFYMCISIYAKF